MDYTPPPPPVPHPRQEPTPPPMPIITSSSSPSSTGAVGGVSPALPTSSQSSSTTAPTSTATTPTPLPKIISRNANGTIVWTSSPSNDAELQLYRVMQRASLLAYYDTLLEMGGDDVQQLCEAGEEEFLEIMALVGMASKPLHVRRLQKALQEWLTNPGMFRHPLGSSSGVGFTPRPVVLGGPPIPLVIGQPQPSPTPLPLPLLPTALTQATPTGPTSPHSHHSAASPSLDNGSASPSASGGPSPQPSNLQPPGSPLAPPPILLESQVAKLAEAAQHLVNTLPQMEPKSHTAKKKMNKDLEQVLSMGEDDPRRMELIRKFAAIYGRFDCKRKPEKPLTLHEVSVNEAAAQICRFMPALLTRRDELFPLARQVVRDSGYHYSKGHSKSYSSRSFNGDQPPYKRSRSDFSPDSEEVIKKRQERLDQIAEELRNVNERAQGLRNGNGNGTTGVGTDIEALQTRQEALILEQTQLVNQSLQPNRLYKQNSSGKISYADDRGDTDDTDSQLSFSDSSPLPEIGDSRDSLAEGSSERSPNGSKNEESDCEGHIMKKGGKEYPDDSYYPEKVQVIASSGGNIIAVANPALLMSPAIKKETVDSKLS